MDALEPFLPPIAIYRALSDLGFPSVELVPEVFNSQRPDPNVYVVTDGRIEAFHYSGVPISTTPVSKVEVDKAVPTLGVLVNDTPIRNEVLTLQAFEDQPTGRFYPGLMRVAEGSEAEAIQPFIRRYVVLGVDNRKLQLVGYSGFGTSVMFDLDRRGLSKFRERMSSNVDHFEVPENLSNYGSHLVRDLVFGKVDTHVITGNDSLVRKLEDKANYLSGVRNYSGPKLVTPTNEAAQMYQRRREAKAKFRDLEKILARKREARAKLST